MHICIQKKLQFLGNAVIFILQFAYYGACMSVAMYAEPLSRDLSEMTYGEQAPLMDSWFLEFMAGWPIGILATSLFVFSIVKQFYVESSAMRLRLNLIVLLALLGLASVSIYYLKPW